jgi:hypothetical protein
VSYCNALHNALDTVVVSLHGSSVIAKVLTFLTSQLTSDCQFAFKGNGKLISLFF